jgi:hypothetical protein
MINATLVGFLTVALGFYIRRWRETFDRALKEKTPVPWAPTLPVRLLLVLGSTAFVCGVLVPLWDFHASPVLYVDIPTAVYSLVVAYAVVFLALRR